MTGTRILLVCAVALIASVAHQDLAAQGGARTVPGAGRRPAPAPAPAAAPAVPAAADGSHAVAVPADYVIGTDDILAIVFWREKDMSSEAVVRPDGKITLPLLNDIDAAGLTTEQLRVRITEASSRYLEDPAVTITVKQINSRKVFILGEIRKPGPYPLTTPTTVLQLIALAGGLSDFAQREDIVVMRTDGGQSLSFPFDYAAVAKRKKLEQNILLKPGDTVLVP